MSVTTLTVTRVGDVGFRLDFASDQPEPTFYVYRDGRAVSEGTQPSYLAVVLPGESPVFEVLDDAEAAPQEGYPAYVTLSWYAGGADVDRYLVQQFVSGVWTTKATVRDSGRPYFTWRSGTLADVTSHQFRVIPVGDNGNQGTATSFTVLMVRYPDPPDVAFSYDEGTGEVTVAAA